MDRPRDRIGVIALHDWGLHLGGWGDFLKDLPAAAFGAFDFRGHGRTISQNTSEARLKTEDDFDLEDLCEDVFLFLNRMKADARDHWGREAEELKWIVLGHGFGAVIGLRVAHFFSKFGKVFGGWAGIAPLWELPVEQRLKSALGLVPKVNGRKVDWPMVPGFEQHRLCRFSISLSHLYEMRELIRDTRNKVLGFTQIPSLMMWSEELQPKEIYQKLGSPEKTAFLIKQAESGEFLTSRKAEVIQGVNSWISKIALSV